MQRTNDSTLSPDEYVSENVDELVHVVKQSTDPWIRGLCLAALVKYSDDEYDIDQVHEELDEIREDMKDA